MSVEPDFLLRPDHDRARAAAEHLFEITAVALRRILPASADIRHVGATAIAGCLTKGDLDIVVRVDAADFETVDAALAARFARNTGSTHSDTFSSFEGKGTVPDLGVQLTVKGSPNDFFHTFVAALAREPELVARYNSLKRQHDGRPMEVYRAAKSVFIEEVLRNIRKCS